MNKTIHFILLASMTLTLVSCISFGRNRVSKRAKERVETVRKTRYFAAVTIEDLCDVHFTQADKPSLKIVGTKEATSRIITVYSGNRLLVRRKMFGNNMFRSGDQDKVDIYIASPDLTEVCLKGSGTFTCDSLLDTDVLKVSLMGMGEVDFADVVCDHLNVELKGSGDVTMQNVRSVTAQLMLQGMGDIDMKLQKVADTDISLLGVGNIEAHLDDCGAAHCSLVGVGDIKLTGSVRSLTKSKKGSGDISTEGLTTR